jgi:hypothetical protein
MSDMKMLSRGIGKKADPALVFRYQVIKTLKRGRKKTPEKTFPDEER